MPISLPLPLRGRGRPRTQNPEIRRTVLSTDFHIPEYDTAAFGSLLNFIRDIRPDYHIILGDLLDLPSLSTFLKDPALENRTEEAIATANAMLDQLHDASPTTITKVLWGNHDYRLTNSLSGKCGIVVASLHG
jgi:predicted MPP superfamily phosphohydrolase